MNNVTLLRRSSCDQLALALLFCGGWHFLGCGLFQKAGNNFHEAGIAFLDEVCNNKTKTPEMEGECP